MRKGRLILLSAIALLVGGLFVVWSYFPTTREMIGTEGYFAWSRGRGETTFPIFQAFTRDRRFRKTLLGESVERVLDKFPQASNGFEYAPDSYRKINEPETASDGHPVDEVYWLNGSNLRFPEESGNAEDNFGYCVLVRDGRVIEFRWIKG